MSTRRHGLVALFAIAAFGPAAVCAHGSKVGDLKVGHPFATPTPPGATTGAAYLATLENRGRQPDRLLRASTPAAERVELHTMSLDAASVMRMRELADLPLAPGEVLQMRPGTGHHLMLVGLRQPLVEGQTFALTLVFERAGAVEVKVYVQVPRRGASEQHRH